jgi:chromosome segregation ATPase
VDNEDAQQLLTQISRIVSDQIQPFREEMRSLHNDTLSHFDTIYRRLDRLESEYQALVAAVKRLESDMQVLTTAFKRQEIAFAEDRAARKDIQSEIEKLKVQVAQLQEQIARLEADAQDA